MTTRGKVAIVTGAGSGIGQAAALALLDDGWRVVLAGRRPDPLEETARSGDPTGTRALVVPTDVSDPASVKALFALAVESFGRVDVLFNNAGVNILATPLEEVTLAEWRAVVDVNLTGMFLCIQEAFRVMKAQRPRGGRIINNGSLSATVPRPHAAPYNATKHGVTGLTKSTALEGRRYDIACSQLDVGNAATDMTERMATGVLQADGRQAIEPRMDVALVGRTVCYLANLPLEANVLFMNLMATKMPFVGRG
jgi:NAD(P)-dependent dehydrogenase (short-subunit alcohol dehydrogenase family)